MDLTQAFPRSPRETMAGLVHLPRMVDKVRAALSGRLGPYIYPCPMDRMMLDFLGLSPDDFTGRVKEADDRQIEKGLEAWCVARGLEEKDKREQNRRLLAHGPETGEKMDYFLQQRDQVAPGRADITTWAGLIDLEEGRTPA